MILLLIPPVQEYTLALVLNDSFSIYISYIYFKFILKDT